MYRIEPLDQEGSNNDELNEAPEPEAPGQEAKPEAPALRDEPASFGQLLGSTLLCVGTLTLLTFGASLLLSSAFEAKAESIETNILLEREADDIAFAKANPELAIDGLRIEYDREEATSSGLTDSLGLSACLNLADTEGIDVAYSSGDLFSDSAVRSVIYSTESDESFIVRLWDAADTELESEIICEVGGTAGAPSSAIL